MGATVLEQRRDLSWLMFYQILPGCYMVRVGPEAGTQVRRLLQSR